ncbi:hypothetical protein M378DRAFT_170517, partial [Amanita muscaria Koide BX008]
MIMTNQRYHWVECLEIRGYFAAWNMITIIQASRYIQRPLDNLDDKWALRL